MHFLIDQKGLSTVEREIQATQELERDLEGRKTSCVKGPHSSIKETSGGNSSGRSQSRERKERMLSRN